MAITGRTGMLGRIPVAGPVRLAWNGGANTMVALEIVVSTDVASIFVFIYDTSSGMLRHAECEYNL
jgi:hypothetical protein